MDQLIVRDYSLPFKLPYKLVPQHVLFVVSRINLMYQRVDSKSPREMFLRRKTDYQKDIQIGFGEYAQSGFPTSDSK